MFDVEGNPRPHYEALYRQLSTLTVEEFEERRRAADASFLNQGITFTVYGEEEAIERIFPFDLIPRDRSRRRVGPARARPDRSGSGRSTCSSHDVYHEQRILRDGVIPAELVLGARQLPPRVIGPRRAAATSTSTSPAST